MQKRVYLNAGKPPTELNTHQRHSLVFPSRPYDVVREVKYLCPTASVSSQHYTPLTPPQVAAAVRQINRNEGLFIYLFI